MKNIIKQSGFLALIAVALSTTLVSFSGRPGGHSVQIYLDSKLVIDQPINSKMDAPRLRLDPSEKYSQLIVKYNECGRTVSGRMMILKDDHDKVLKDWRFDGESSGFKESMTCPVKDIMAQLQKGSSPLKLYYSSKEFPAGQQIAWLVTGGDMNTSLN